jgi:enoyl-CoA hydratase
MTFDFSTGDSMSFKTIRFETVNKIGRLTINRPEKLNALSVEVFEELRMLFTSIVAHANLPLSGILLTGAGDRAFIAGADIKAMSAMTGDEGEAFGRLAQEVTLMIEALPFPVIACVNGYALGGGCELAMSCDFIFATESAVFGQPEVNLGLIPGFGGCVRLSRYVGPGIAKELIYTGRNVKANEALTLGLVNRVFSSQQEMLDGALSCLETIARKSPTAVALCKQIINDSVGEATTSALAIEATGFRTAFETEDKREGVSAFLEKRPAVFPGR